MHRLVEQTIDLRMLVEATLDFPEEEIDFLEKADARGRLERICGALDKVLDRARSGALLREGIKVVLAGQPNVGKISLLNALAGAELRSSRRSRARRAIKSARPSRSRACR